MKAVHWIGIIVWGVLLTAFGIVSADPALPACDAAMQAHDVVFLLAGGLVSCLIGTVGLLGTMGWIPALQQIEESY